MKFITKKKLGKSTYLLLAIAACAVVSSGKEEARAVIGKGPNVVNSTGARSNPNRMISSSSGSLDNVGVTGTVFFSRGLGRSASTGDIRGNNTKLPDGNLTRSLPNLKLASSSPSLNLVDDGIGGAAGGIRPRPTNHKYGFAASDFNIDGKTIEAGKKYVQYVDKKGKLKTFEKTTLNRLKLFFSQDQMGVESGIDPKTGKPTKYIYRTAPRWVSGRDIINQQGTSTGGGKRPHLPQDGAVVTSPTPVPRPRPQDGGTGVGVSQGQQLPQNQGTQDSERGNIQQSQGSGTLATGTAGAGVTGTGDTATGTSTGAGAIGMETSKVTISKDKIITGGTKDQYGPQKFRSSLHLDIDRTGDGVIITKRDSKGQTRTTGTGTGDTQTTGTGDGQPGDGQLRTPTPQGIRDIRNVTDDQIIDKFGDQRNFLLPVSRVIEGDGDGIGGITPRTDEFGLSYDDIVGMTIVRNAAVRAMGGDPEGIPSVREQLRMMDRASRGEGITNTRDQVTTTPTGDSKNKTIFESGDPDFTRVLMSKLYSIRRDVGGGEDNRSPITTIATNTVEPTRQHSTSSSGRSTPVQGDPDVVQAGQLVTETQPVKRPLTPFPKMMSDVDDVQGTDSTGVGPGPRYSVFPGMSEEEIREYREAVDKAYKHLITQQSNDDIVGGARRKAGAAPLNPEAGRLFSRARQGETSGDQGRGQTETQPVKRPLTPFPKMMSDVDDVQGTDSTGVGQSSGYNDPTEGMTETQRKEYYRGFERALTKQVQEKEKEMKRRAQQSNDDIVGGTRRGAGVASLGTQMEQEMGDAGTTSRPKSPGVDDDPELTRVLELSKTEVGGEEEQFIRALERSLVETDASAVGAVGGQESPDLELALRLSLEDARNRESGPVNGIYTFKRVILDEDGNVESDA